jgi:hypothetical protein
MFDDQVSSMVEANYYNLKYNSTEGRSHELCFNNNISINNQRSVTSLCFELHILSFIMIIFMNYLFHL